MSCRVPADDARYFGFIMPETGPADADDALRKYNLMFMMLGCLRPATAEDSFIYAGVTDSICQGLTLDPSFVFESMIDPLGFLH